MALPRISSRTPLYHEHRRNSSASSIPPAMLFGLPVSRFLGLHPRKIRHRSTLLAVAVLFILATYILVYHTILSARVLHLKDPTTAAQMAAALDNAQHSHILNSLGPGKKPRPLRQGTQISLDAAQELAAISSFLASLPQNHIPPSVDPSVPIDPQLVLDFDTSSLRAADEVQAMVDDVWLQNPVFLYSKRYSSVSREIKAMLADMYLKPEPTIIDVDVRDDADVLTRIIARITSPPGLPALLIGGKYVGSIDQIRALHQSGELRKLVAESGAVIDGAKRRKHRKRT